MTAGPTGGRSRAPLAAVGCFCLTAFPAGEAARAIAAGDWALRTQALPGRNTTVRHTSVSLDGAGPELADRYREAFDLALAALGDTIRALPRHVPFDVHLQLPPEADRPLLRERWISAWNAQGLRRGTVSLAPADTGMMFLDQWLDIPGGPALERFVLFVSARLYSEPPSGGAEAVAAVLLGWGALAVRQRMPVLAFVHRPVEAKGDGESAAALADALLWGELDVGDVKEAWHSGGAERSAFLGHASGFDFTQAEGASGYHDVTAALGDARKTADWLLLALAVERIAEVQKPQLVVSEDENTTRFAIVRSDSLGVTHR